MTRLTQCSGAATQDVGTPFCPGILQQFFFPAARRSRGTIAGGVDTGVFCILDQSFPKQTLLTLGGYRIFRLSSA